MIKRSYLCGGSLLAVTIAMGLSAPAFAQSNAKAAPAPTDVEEVVGSYCFDEETKQLHIHPTDSAGAGHHVYGVVPSTNGITVANQRR